MSRIDEARMQFAAALQRGTTATIAEAKDELDAARAAEVGKMETKHTPTPWRVSDQRPDVIWDNGGRCVTDLSGDRLSCGDKVADANLIVRAVNAHDALVEALSNLVDEILNLVDDGTLDKSALEHASISAAHAALAQAEDR